MKDGVLIDLGVQSFEKIRHRNSFYIDKTEFLKEWWEKGADVTLITRPRRFGKTLNLSMTECFFSNQYAGRSDLFEGLSIWKEESFRQYQGSYPVLFFSFAKVKAVNYEEMKDCVKKIIYDLFEQHRYLLCSDRFSENEKAYFCSVKPGMDDSTALDALNTLTGFLSRYYEKDVIILLDEYDTPMQEAWLSGYWSEAVGFFRSFLNAALKTNRHLYRGLVTGITRISRESVFSDLNNLEVVTVTCGKYADFFGFTEQEVFQALDRLGYGAQKQDVKNWYNGFIFGSRTDIYNPWSIASFLSNDAKYRTYWADTSSNGLVNRLIREGSAQLKRRFEMLLDGQHIKVAIEEQIVYDQLEEGENAVWSLLLSAGYLKAVSIDDSCRKDGLGEDYYELALTNFEVRRMFAKMVRGWFRNSAEVYNEFIKALLSDNVKKMNTFMNKVALQTFSVFDSGKKPSQSAQPERFYHGFVLGMVVDLSDRYKVKSNRESGYGRYDVLIEPFDTKNGKAFIFEFKVLEPDEEACLEDTVANALAQINEKNYEAELISDGIPPENIRKYGFAFEGKQCLIG